MTDRLGPWRITFDTNPDDCNLKCIMCEEHSIYSSCQTNRKEAGLPRRRMDIDLIRRILEDSKEKGLKEIIPSTMGEPLLYRHFEEIIQLCCEYGVKLNLTTNGTFPKYGATEWAKRIVPVGSDVKISWNGATKRTSELIMIGSNFEDRLQNVKDFIAVRDQVAREGGNFCRVTFQLTFIEMGLDELPDVIRLAAAIGVNRVKGHHLWVFTSEMKDQSLRRSPESIKRWNEIVYRTMEAVEDHRLPTGEKVLLENIFPLEESATEELLVEGVCPFLGEEAWVSATGVFGPCCAPNEDRQTLGHFGSLYEKSLQEIWDGKEYKDLQENYLNYPVCKRCNMRKIKGDKLIANT